MGILLTYVAVPFVNIRKNKNWVTNTKASCVWKGRIPFLPWTIVTSLRRHSFR